MTHTAAAIAALAPSDAWDIYVGQQDPTEFAPAGVDVEQEIRDYTQRSPVAADLDSAARAALAAQLTSYATHGHGTLTHYQTGEAIRPATAAELAASIEAAELDGGAGVIEVEIDGVTVSAFVI